jgi:arylsulfatase A-like enzyme
VRTDRYKYIRYPHGDGGSDRHLAELYDLENDPDETKNLIQRTEHAAIVATLQAELDRLIKDAGAVPDKMPLDEGIKSGLPEKSIR